MGLKDTFIKYFSVFSAILSVLKLESKKKLFCTNSTWVSQNAKFDAEFEFVKKNAKNLPKKSDSSKTFAHNNILLCFGVFHFYRSEKLHFSVTVLLIAFFA
jgi:hypothetical protein